MHKAEEWILIGNAAKDALEAYSVKSRSLDPTSLVGKRGCTLEIGQMLSGGKKNWNEKNKKP